jgi:hypothetical protein
MRGGRADIAGSDYRNFITSNHFYTFLIKIFFDKALKFYFGTADISTANVLLSFRAKRKKPDALSPSHQAL